jgi:hypothetical protein
MRSATPRAAVALAVLALALAGCSGGGPVGDAPTPCCAPTSSGTDGLGNAPTTTPPAPPPAAVKALTCEQLKNTTLGSATVKYNEYNDGIPLSGGTWSGEDGFNVTFRECGIGDLNGDGAADGLASIVRNNGGTGQFYTLAYWRNAGGKPAFAALFELDDRTPVEKISIAGGKAKVTWLTRTDDFPLAGVNLRRTSVFTLVNGKLVEDSHTDAPYTP